MPDHDWLGAEVTPEVLAEVRADERERIAQAIEAIVGVYVSRVIGWDSIKYVPVDHAALIARSGGPDAAS